MNTRNTANVPMMAKTATARGRRAAATLANTRYSNTTVIGTATTDTRSRSFAIWLPICAPAVDDPPAWTEATVPPEAASLGMSAVVRSSA